MRKNRQTTEAANYGIFGNPPRPMNLGKRAGAILALVCLPSYGYLNAQEEEPPRIFRGGIVQQLRSLTESAMQNRNEKSQTDGRKASQLPQPPALEGSVNSKLSDTSDETQASPIEKRTANLRTPNTNNSKSTQAARSNNRSNAGSTTGSLSDTRSKATANTSPQNKPITNKPITNKPVANKPSPNKGSQPLQREPDVVVAPKAEVARRNTEMGIPVTNSKLAEEARFRLADGPEEKKSSESRGYSANSRYDSNDSTGDAPNPKSLSSDLPKVQAVDTERAPKVARKALPPNAHVATKPDNVSEKHSVRPGSNVSPKKPSAPETVFESNVKNTQSGLPSYPSLDQGKTASREPNAFGESTETTATKPKAATKSTLPLLPQAQQLSSSETAPAKRDAGQAMASGNPIRGANSVANDEQMSMETPRLQVLLKGPKDLPVATPSEYVIVVRNADNIPLDGVILRLEIPDGVSFIPGKPTHGELQSEKAPDGATLVSWGFNDLAAYQNAEAPIQITAAQPRNFALAMEWTLLPKSGETKIDVRQAQLELALEGPSETEFGEKNMYHLHVRNLGTAVAKAVKVKLEAAAFGSSEADVGDINPGEQQSVDVELTFNEKGTISILAVATSSNQKSDAKIDVVVKRPMIDIMMAGSARVVYGSPSNYELRIHNSGDADARGLVGTLNLPDGAELVSTPENVKVNGNQVVWEMPVLKTGQTFAIPLDVKLSAAGENSFSFTCSGKHFEPKTAGCITAVEAIADLKLVVNDPIAPAPVDGVATYELTITNRGSLAATNVRALAQFSEGIEPINADGAQHKVLTGQVVFEPIASIQPGETKSLKIYAKAGAAGVHRFRAEVRSDETEMRLVQEETTQYLQSESRMASPINNKSIVR
jgi:Domain of unknown function DUF11/CARDB